MKISLNWLRQYIPLSLPVDELVKGLTNLGIEVESVENQAEKLKNFVIGKVLERKKHPNADKLSVCKVDAGTGEILNIVCGAPNVDTGQTVCVALVGAIVPNGEFEIKKAKIRGEASEGMICSAKELNMGEDHSGIMVLDTELPLGTPFAEYLKQSDVIIEIGITPNRGDLLSHLGVARELGALTCGKVTEPSVKEITGKDLKGKIEVEIENPKGCYRYCGALINNITVKESPDWLKNYIIAAGLRPINNIVDITNYVMLECGQPLHAFDYDKIAGKKIIVKDARGTKKFTTLDGKERELKDDILLICDGEKPVALAGIMGGANSEISAGTKNVFIESAYFNPILTRKSSKYLGLQTDSSYRFERGVDIEKTEWACKRAASLMAEIAGGEIVQGFIDNYPTPLEKPVVDMRISRLIKITGVDFTKEKAVKLLESIKIKLVKEEGEKLYFEVPLSRREDLQREADLIEEVIRLYGYDNIKESEYDTIRFDNNDYDQKRYDGIRLVRKFIEGRGFSEVITNTLVDENLQKRFSEDYIKLLNPLNDKMNVLRTSLYIGLFDVILLNFENMNDSLKLYETGETFAYMDKKIAETSHLMLTMAGNYDVKAFDLKPREYHLNDMVSEVNTILGKLRVENYENYDYYNVNDFCDYSIEYAKNNVVFAKITNFRKKFLDSLNISKPVIVCEILY